MSATECHRDHPCRMHTAAHADDYEIAGVAVHLGGEWWCPVHGIGEDDGLTVEWGSVEVSLDAIAAVREDAAATDRDLGYDDAAAIFIRTPEHVAVHCSGLSDTGDTSRRALASRLAGVVLHHAVGAGDLDRDVVVSFAGWTAETEDRLINRAGWATDALLSDRGDTLINHAVLAGMLDGIDYDASAGLRVEVSPESVTIHLEVCDLGDLSTVTWLRMSEPIADRGDVDWLIARTEDAIADRAV